jgi:hypothetical protein
MTGPDGEFPARIELCAAAIGTADAFPNILASLAFRIMSSQALYSPGVIAPDAVCGYYPSTRLPHLYLTAPFLWPDLNRVHEFGARKVTWLLALPISEAEAGYRREQGDHALEQLLEKHSADFANLDRPSVI